MRATDKIKQMGIEMTEMIDQAYVLGKDESVKTLGEKILEQGADIAYKWGDYALDKAMVFLNNPQNLDVALKKGMEIAPKSGLEKIIGGAIKGAVEELIKKD